MFRSLPVFFLVSGTGEEITKDFLDGSGTLQCVTRIVPKNMISPNCTPKKDSGIFGFRLFCLA